MIVKLGLMKKDSETDPWERVVALFLENETEPCQIIDKYGNGHRHVHDFMIQEDCIEIHFDLGVL
jgi:hypothetical protein